MWYLGKLKYFLAKTNICIYDTLDNKILFFKIFFANLKLAKIWASTWPNIKPANPLFKKPIKTCIIDNTSDLITVAFAMSLYSFILLL